MVRLTIQAKPGSSKEGFALRSDGSLVAQIRAPAADNKANDRLVQLLAQKLKIPQKNIEIVRGQTHRSKIIQIETLLSLSEICEKLLKTNS